MQCSRYLADLVQEVSPDGRHLLYGLIDIMTLPLGGERKPAAYLQTKARENERKLFAGRTMGGIRFGRIREASNLCAGVPGAPAEVVGFAGHGL